LAPIGSRRGPFPGNFRGEHGVARNTPDTGRASANGQSRFRGESRQDYVVRSEATSTGSRSHFRRNHLHQELTACRSAPFGSTPSTSTHESSGMVTHTRPESFGSCQKYRALYREPQRSREFQCFKLYLGNLLRRLVLPPAIQSWSLTSLQQRLFKT